MKRATIATLCALLFAGGCSDDSTSDPAPSGPEPVANPEAAAAAFRLYYKERVDRALVAYNRFALFGDIHFGTVIDGGAWAKTGNRYEVVAGPNDNNLIGTSVHTVWKAYQQLRTRKLELTLRRMFGGLVFVGEVTGHEGVTVRAAMPGWTREVDGEAGTVSHTRMGESFEHPWPADPAFEAEVLEAFFDGVHFTYRENPREYMQRLFPAFRTDRYGITYSHSIPDDFMRVSDCCSSLRRTPEGRKWAGAYWGNHNSRDNFPDLALGYIAAFEAAADPSLPAELRAVAERAAEVGRQVGDLVQETGGQMMTVDEHNPYDTLVLSGERRPHGLSENEVLGTMSACPMAYLARAISTDGLDLPAPNLPLPGIVEQQLVDELGSAVECEIVEDRRCRGLEDAYCGTDWSGFQTFEIFGMPWLDVAAGLEAANAGGAEQLLGAFQNDYDDVVESMVALAHYARTTGDAALLEDVLANLQNMTDLMRLFADVIFETNRPERWAQQRYEAAIFDGSAGLTPIVSDLGGFSEAEARIARIEAMLEPEDTTPAALKTDEELRAEIFGRLEGLRDANGSGRSDAIRARYAEAFGEELPVRRAGEGYEARLAGGEWQPAEVPRHRGLSKMTLLQAIPLCETSPELLDCTWAALGCERPDLDDNGRVDAADASAFAAAFATGTDGGGRCDEANDWCGGADLDRTGRLDDRDEAFMAAADGCYYDRAP